MKTGTIIKGVGSFYYVRTPEGEVARCKARGLFRKEGITPTVGDNVRFSVMPDGDDFITQILPRQNLIKRPAVANATMGVIVCAIKDPDISYLLLDKTLVLNAYSSLKSIICFNKSDLANKEDIDFIMENYAGCGADILFTNAKKAVGLDELEDHFRGNITIFSGVSGAGKSTIISYFCPDIEIETGEVSQKNKRGRHTTRHSEIFVTTKGDYIVDTPGFSSLSLDIAPDDLWKYYPEFYEYSDCKYANCVHLNEPECRVKSAVGDQLISSVRYENYLYIYKELKENQSY